MKKWLKMLMVCSLLVLTAAITETRHRADADQPTSPALTTSSLKCPKCQGAMEEGFLLDQQGYNSVFKVTQWVEGPPKKKFGYGVETKVERNTSAFRCVNCGYLELYAK
jgi:predicted nucleic-acid-binding Zn-ribbon protein